MPRASRPVDETVLDWRGQWPLILGFVVLLLVAGISIWLTIDSRRQNELVAHTLEVETTANSFFINVQGAETGQRGYLLTLKPEYDQRHREGMARAPGAFQKLVRLTADNPDEQVRLESLKRPLDAKLAELSHTMELARTGHLERALEIVRTGYGRTLMVDIRGKVEALVAEENRLLIDRRRQAESNAIMLLAVTLAGLVVVMVLAAMSFRNIQRYTGAIQAQADNLRNLNENLEEIVADRTENLVAANEEIQRYAYIVSHDLRAPLVNIMGFTSELDAARKDIERFRTDAVATNPELEKSDAMRAIDTDLGESIDFIRASTQKMDRLINAILKISREGRRVLTPESVDMTVLLEGVGKTVAHQLAEAGGRIEVQKLPPIASDRLALEQVFGNLIGNAVKYLARGVPPEIVVSGEQVDSNIVYSVSDNGRGIDARDHERIFDLFRRAGTQDKPGEGIGLAHVRALVRRLGGNITVKSTLGAGSTFVITLPRRLKDEGVAL